MQYETINLPEKTVVGLKARTSNASPDMGQVIGSLWQNFFQTGIFENIQNKADAKSLGVYSGYASDDTGAYDITVACAVTQAEEVPCGAVVMQIPAGRYAKFVIKGHMQKAVADFWKQLWNMDLPRSYVCDFEEYQNNSIENAEIHIYIGLK